jgi:hypothetical protein
MKKVYLPKVGILFESKKGTYYYNPITDQGQFEPFDITDVIYLPDNWDLIKSLKGTFYFYNRTTGKSQYKIPDDTEINKWYATYDPMIDYYTNDDIPLPADSYNIIKVFEELGIDISKDIANISAECKNKNININIFLINLLKTNPDIRGLDLSNCNFSRLSLENFKDIKDIEVDSLREKGIPIPQDLAGSQDPNLDYLKDIEYESAFGRLSYRSDEEIVSKLNDDINSKPIGEKGIWMDRIISVLYDNNILYGELTNSNITTEDLKNVPNWIYNLYKYYPWESMTKLDTQLIVELLLYRFKKLKIIWFNTHNFESKNTENPDLSIKECYENIYETFETYLPNVEIIDTAYDSWDSFYGEFNNWVGDIPLWSLAGFPLDIMIKNFLTRGFNPQEGYDKYLINLIKDGGHDGEFFYLTNDGHDNNDLTKSIIKILSEFLNKGVNPRLDILLKIDQENEEEVENEARQTIVKSHVIDSLDEINPLLVSDEKINKYLPSYWNDIQPFYIYDDDGYQEDFADTMWQQYKYKSKRLRKFKR